MRKLINSIMIFQIIIISMMLASCTKEISVPYSESIIDDKDATIDEKDNTNIDEKQEFNFNVVNAKSDVTIENDCVLLDESLYLKKSDSVQVVKHNNEIYYLDDNIIYIIDEKTKTDREFFDGHEVLEILEEEYPIYDLEGFFFLKNDLYGIISVDAQGGYEIVSGYIFNLYTLEKMTSFEGFFYGMHENEILYDADCLSRELYYIPTLKVLNLNDQTNKIVFEKDFQEEYMYSEGVNIYYTDKYIIAKTVTHSEEEPRWTYYLNIIDKETLNNVAVFNLAKISDNPLEFIKYENNLIYFYDMTQNSILEFDYINKTTTVVVEFENDCKYIGYDYLKDCIYMKENYNFSHGPYQYHYDLEECMEDIPNAKQRIVEFDLINYTYNILATYNVSALYEKDICGESEGKLEKQLCINKFNEVVCDNYLFFYGPITKMNYSYYFKQTGFSYKMKLWDHSDKNIVGSYKGYYKNNSGKMTMELKLMETDESMNNQDAIVKFYPAENNSTGLSGEYSVEIRFDSEEGRYKVISQNWISEQPDGYDMLDFEFEDSEYSMACEFIREDNKEFYLYKIKE